MNSPQQTLKLVITLQSQKGEKISSDNFYLDYTQTMTQFTLPIRLVLSKINQFLKGLYLTVSQYLNIWVVTKNSRQNLFKLKKKGLDLRLMANEQDGFEINILLVDVSQKNNTLKNFNQTIEQYNRLNANINKIIDESRKEAEKKGQRELRPIDIAYLFADPLVEVRGLNSQPRSKSQVSFQTQYDKFIQMIREQDLGSNLRIEMMVATETNIKNTLIDGVSVLHFACHGKKGNGNLQIERERPVGQQMDLQQKRFKKLLQNKTLPKVIVFNACFSSILARKISEEMKVLTIGYNDEANDIYCQQFTREFYKGLFKDKQPPRLLFQIIKKNIIQKNQLEGKKLEIFPEEPIAGQEIPIIEVAEQNVNWVQKWTLLQSLRSRDPIGIKKQMYKFIKDLLTQNQRMEYLFFLGAPSSGKSLFMQKTRIYVMNRKVFTEDLVIDLKNQSGSVHKDSMLSFRLQKQALIDKKMAEFKQIGKDRRVRPLIILDHFQKIIRFQCQKLLSYINQKFIKKFKQGKVVIISNQIEPKIEEEAKSFGRVIRHKKEVPQLQDNEIRNLVNRYTRLRWNNTLKNSFNSLRYQKDISPIHLVEAFKKSETPELLEQNYLQIRADASRAKINQERANQQLTIQTAQLQESIHHEINQVSMQIKQNNYIFLSTIFDQIVLRKLRSINSNQLIKIHSNTIYDRVQGNRFSTLVKSFKSFFLCFTKESSKQAIRSKVKQIINLSLKLAAVCYLQGQFSLFEDHLLNCEKLYTIITAVFWEQLKRVKQIQNKMEQINLACLLRDYRLRILLSLYSFYSQNKFQLQARDFKSSQEKQTIVKLIKKIEVITQQLNRQFQKKQLTYYHNSLQHLYVINNIAQELHYKTQYRFLNHDSGRERRESDIYDLSNDQIDYQQNANKIDLHHKKLQQYWKHYLELVRLFNHCEVLSRDSLLLILLVVMKLVFYNHSELQQVQVKGEQLLQLNRLQYIALYIQIMEKIKQTGVFSTKNLDSIFYYQQNDCIRLLYKTYLKNFISIYFQLEKSRQAITKDYNLKIYYQLINLCDNSTSITLPSLHKMIELHISEQFFNTWSVKTYISMPLFGTQNNKRLVRINLQRYQEHIIKFQHCLFKHQLDKEINFKVSLLSKKNLEQEANLHQNSSKNIIYLLVCDCKINNNKSDSDKICLESEKAQLQTQKLRNVVLPKAPIVIVFGANVSRLKAWYQQQKSQSIIICIDMKDNDFEKQMKIDKLEQYAVCLQIYYSVLEFFYCSFCRHFFNADHKLFVEQVRSSFHLAKAQAMIKTKIRFCTGTQFKYKDIIEQIITDIDFNLKYLLQSSFGAQLQTKPAYHFIYKQRKPRHHDKCRFDDIRHSIRAQIGANQQIFEVLSHIQSMGQKYQEFLNLKVEYKSEQMLNYFLRSLKIKIQKLDNFTIDKNIINTGNFSQYSKNIKRQQTYTAEDNCEETKSQMTEVRFFCNLTAQQTLHQLQSCASNCYKTVRIFCYNQIPQQVHPKIHLGVYIEQSNQNSANRCQFQLYFLERMNDNNYRWSISESRFTAIYKKIFERNDKNKGKSDVRSLKDIRSQVQSQKQRNK